MTRARATWASDVAEVLLHVILSTNNSQRSRSAAMTAITHLGSLLDVDVGVWLGPVLCTLQPPLTARRIVPVRVRGLCGSVLSTVMPPPLSAWYTVTTACPSHAHNPPLTNRACST